jgi:hypothetical protein
MTEERRGEEWRNIDTLYYRGDGREEREER